MKKSILKGTLIFSFLTVTLWGQENQIFETMLRKQTDLDSTEFYELLDALENPNQHSIFLESYLNSQSSLSHPKRFSSKNKIAIQQKNDPQENSLSRRLFRFQFTQQHKQFKETIHSTWNTECTQFDKLNFHFQTAFSQFELGSLSKQWNASFLSRGIPRIILDSASKNALLLNPLREQGALWKHSSSKFSHSFSAFISPDFISFGGFFKQKSKTVSPFLQQRIQLIHAQPFSQSTLGFHIQNKQEELKFELEETYYKDQIGWQGSFLWKRNLQHEYSKLLIRSASSKFINPELHFITRSLDTLNNLIRIYGRGGSDLRWTWKQKKPIANFSQKALLDFRNNQILRARHFFQIEKEDPFKQALNGISIDHPDLRKGLHWFQIECHTLIPIQPYQIGWKLSEGTVIRKQNKYFPLQLLLKLGSKNFDAIRLELQRIDFSDRTVNLIYQSNRQSKIFQKKLLFSLNLKLLWNPSKGLFDPLLFWKTQFQF